MATTNFFKKDANNYYVVCNNNITLSNLDFEFFIENITNRFKEIDRYFKADNKIMQDYYKIGEIEDYIFPPLNLVFEITLNYGYYCDYNLDYEVKLLYEYTRYYENSIKDKDALLDYLKEEIKFILLDNKDYDKIISLELDLKKNKDDFDNLNDYIEYLACESYKKIQSIVAEKSKKIESVFKEFSDTILELGGVFSNGEAVYFEKK